MKAQDKSKNQIRRDLHCMFTELIARSEKTQAQIGEILGCAQPYISNMLRDSYECSLELLLEYVTKLKGKVHTHEVHNRYVITIDFPSSI